jgi:hypothetical protein
MAERRIYKGNGHQAVIEDPENITKDECMALAKCGATAWNSWRETFPSTVIYEAHGESYKNAVNFSNLELIADLDFSGFNFGDGSTFQNSTFGDFSDFRLAKFGQSASFENTHFAGFFANFLGAQFGFGSRFIGVTFECTAQFDGAQFDEFACFSEAIFHSGAYFRGAQLGRHAQFDCVTFHKGAFFQGSNWESIEGKYGLDYESHKQWSIRKGLEPNKFASISFSGSVFNREVSFENREFTDTTSFGLCEVKGGARVATQFLSAPKFHNCKFHQNTSFEGAQFPSTNGSEEAARAYRTLKLAFAQQQAIREEQRFFKLEMEEEAARETGLRSFLYRVYKYTSDFGFSAWLPLKTLILYSALFCSALYFFALGVSHPALQSMGLINFPELLSKWLQFTIANMVPLPDSGFLKDLRLHLFGPSPFASVIALIVEITQKFLALVGYFLIGLALRNLFKMK